MSWVTRGKSQKPSGLGSTLTDKMGTTVTPTPRKTAEFIHMTHLEQCLALCKYSINFSH